MATLWFIYKRYPLVSVTYFATADGFAKTYGSLMTIH